MQKKYLQLFSFLGLMLAGLGSALPVWAQPAPPCDPGAGGINLGDCLRLSDDSLVSSVYNNPASLVNLLARNLFVVAGVFLFGLMLMAGLKIIAGGKGGKQGLDEAKTMLTSVAIGFAIMFAAYWIVQIVKILTGANIVL